jgi:phage-related protein
MDESPQKKVKWAPGAHKAIMELPEAVRREFGHELFMVQKGEQPENASPFEGSSGTNIMKLVERYDKNTYRCVYSAKLETGVYVLHAYMKKSKEGKSTPQQVIELVEERYKAAVEMDKQALVEAEALVEERVDGDAVKKSNRGKKKL